MDASADEDQRLGMTLEQIIQLEREKRFIKNVSETPHSPQLTFKFDCPLDEQQAKGKVRPPSPQVSSTYQANFYNRAGIIDRGPYNRILFHPYRKVTQVNEFKGNWSGKRRNGYRGSKMKQVGGGFPPNSQGGGSSTRNGRGNSRFRDHGNNASGYNRRKRSSSICSTDSRRSCGSNVSLNSNCSYQSRNSCNSRGSNWSLNSNGSFKNKRGKGKRWNRRRNKRFFRHKWYPSKDITYSIQQTIDQFALESSPCKLLNVGNVTSTIITPRACDMSLNERFRYLCCH